MVGDMLEALKRRAALLRLISSNFEEKGGSFRLPRKLTDPEDQASQIQQLPDEADATHA